MRHPQPPSIASPRRLLGLVAAAQLACATDKARPAPSPPRGTAPVTAAPSAPPAPAPACPFALCEGFETVPAGAKADPALWRSRGDVVVDAAHARSGAQALRVRVPPRPAETYISNETLLPRLGRSFHGRVFFYIARRPTDFYHWSIAEVRGEDARGASVRWGGISVGCEAEGAFCRNSYLFQLKPQVYGPDEGATLDDAFEPVIAEKTWHCLEWKLDADAREARLWWNGEERPRQRYANGKPELAFPDFVRFYVGWALYQTGKSGVPWEVHLDDLAVDRDRIGCAR